VIGNCYTEVMRARQLRQGIVAGVLLVVSFWLAYLIFGLADKAQIAITEAGDAERQYQAIEERKAMLEASIAALSTERGKDAAIRMSFGVAKPGEEVIVVVPSATATPTATPSWWQWIFDWF